MKKAEILTSNNVAIQYELASLAQRILGFILDGLILGVYYLICLFLIFAIAANNEFAGQVFVYILYLPVFFFYNLFCEIYLDGQSLGKKIMRIKVMKIGY